MTGNDNKIVSGCYIGANATILPRVTIGDCYIVGAGAVPTTDVPDGSFATGVPAVVKAESFGALSAGLLGTPVGCVDRDSAKRRRNRKLAAAGAHNGDEGWGRVKADHRSV